MRVDHVAVLVRSLESVLALLPESVVLGAIEEFPGEGTRECYVTIPGSDSASLLLLEAIGPGPYDRALRRRGPGLHHLAITVPRLGDMAEPLTAWGMRLHPHSLESIPRGTAWACGGGVPFLLEIHERAADSNRPCITRIEMTFDSQSPVEHLAPGLFTPRNSGLVIHFANGALLTVPLN